MARQLLLLRRGCSRCHTYLLWITDMDGTLDAYLTSFSFSALYFSSVPRHCFVVQAVHRGEVILGHPALKYDRLDVMRKKPVSPSYVFAVFYKSYWDGSIFSKTVHIRTFSIKVRFSRFGHYHTSWHYWISVRAGACWRDSTTENN